MQPVDGIYRDIAVVCHGGVGNPIASADRTQVGDSPVVDGRGERKVFHEVKTGAERNGMLESVVPVARHVFERFA